MKKVIYIFAALISFHASAAEPTNIALGRNYKRVQGNDKDICPPSVRPTVERNEEGAPVLTLAAKIGFLWQSSTQEPERFDNCTLHQSQTLTEKGQVTVMTQKSLADCTKPNLQMTSSIETLTLKGNEIEYELVPQVKSKITGRWIADENKKPTVCRYSLK